MVRLVFRPYTQVRRTICTSVSLRASIRVSPDFALLRHSSPSFGSQRIRSNSDLSCNARPVDGAPAETGSHLSNRNDCLYFHCALGFDTQILAYTLDSLVRVSRRVEAIHFVKISNLRVSTSTVDNAHRTYQFMLSTARPPGSKPIRSQVV
jgi:hypothetical protein